MAWYANSMSLDGSKLVVSDGVRLKRSTDYGVSFSEIQPVGDVNYAWRGVCQSYDGSVIVATARNVRQWMSTNSGSSWSEIRPKGDVNWVCYSCSTNNDGSVILLGGYYDRCYISTDSGVNWNETQPIGNVTRLWHSSAMDETGNVIALGYAGGAVVSLNKGTTWTQPAFATVGNWYAQAVSGNGNVVILNKNGEALVYVSTDGGYNFVTRTAPNAVNGYSSAACNYDGSVIFLTDNGTNNNPIVYSADYGVTWSRFLPAVLGDWVFSELSGDGKTISALNRSDLVRAYIGTSTAPSFFPKNSTVSSGRASRIISLTLNAPTLDGLDVPALVTNFAALATQPVASSDWYGGDMSDDGSVIFASAYGGRAWLSTNYGASWTEKQILGDTDQDWGFCSVSGDGNVILTCTAGGRVYLSTNGGTSFAETQPKGDVNSSWDWATACDQDGSVLMIGDGSRLYLSTDTGANWAETRPIGDVNVSYHAMSMNGDGSLLAVQVNHASVTNAVYQSVDYGVNWTVLKEISSAYSISISNNGNIIVIGQEGSPYDLFVSFNGGTNFTTFAGAGFATGAWASVGSDETGQYLIGGKEGGGKGTYTSNDSGVTWVQYLPASDSFLGRVSVDGKFMMSAEYGGVIYSSDNN